MKTQKLTKMQEAYQRCEMMRRSLGKLGRCMEVTEDKKYGILWERWLVGKTSVVLLSTPDWTEVFKPLTEDMTWDGTVAALETVAKA
jgi:hypothetical protein